MVLRTVQAQEVFLFADHMRSRQAGQRLDVRERLVGCERLGKDSWVSGNPQIGKKRGPSEAKEIGIGSSSFEEPSCFLVSAMGTMAKPINHRWLVLFNQINQITVFFFRGIFQHPARLHEP